MANSIGSFDQFSIHHVEGDKVSVWISSLRQTPPTRALREHLELLLPIPENLRESFLSADSGKEGFLMKDSEKYVGASYAEFEFGSKK